MNKNGIRLTYIMATKNKFTYLRRGLEQLIAVKKDDEEILVADGASTDGTKEYLAELKAAGKIDFVSEKDYCESHALNKMFLKARGELIKIINDDDAYYYPVIEACKEFMLSHPDIEVMGMEGGSFKHDTPNSLKLLQVSGYVENFKKWKEHHTPFEFAVLGVMFRRSSLPILGFWDLSFKNADAEYTFRVTAGPAKLAWCLSPAFVFIRTLEGVTWNNLQRMQEEARRLRKFYLDEDPPSRFRQSLKAFLKEAWRIATFKPVIKPVPFSAPWEKLFGEAKQWLKETNEGKEVRFLS